MLREYFCPCCGLFFWMDPYISDGIIGRTNYVSRQSCPNKECLTQHETDVSFFAVDTMAFAYFCENNKDFVDKIKWSSPLYAPKDAIKIYKQQGIKIIV